MLRREEKILLYGSNLWALGEGMLGPLFAVFAQRIGGDVFDISWAWAAYLFATGVLMIVFGRFSDKWDKKKVVVLGYAINALATFGYLLVSKPLHLLFVQVSLGLANALATPSWSALYSKYEKTAESGYEWGLADGDWYVVTAVALIIGGFIVENYSFSALFIVMGCVQIVSTIYQARILKT